MTASTAAPWLGGRLMLHQPATGHRAGTDAVLLAGLAPPAGRVVDLGAGVGSVGLARAAMHPDSLVTLVENDPASLAHAAANIRANGLESRVRIVDVDIFAPEARRVAAGLPREGADLVLTNPPFATPGQGRPSPDPGRRRAHVLQGGDLADWLRSAASCLAPGGRLGLIHRADCLPEVLDAAARFGEIRLRFVHPAPGRAATRLLLLARKGSRARLEVLAPLNLAGADGAPDPLFKLLERGAGEPLIS